MYVSSSFAHDDDDDDGREVPQLFFFFSCLLDRGLVKEGYFYSMDLGSLFPLSGKQSGSLGLRDA